MTATYDDSTGNGSNLNFDYTFPILQTEDVRVALNSIVQSKTKYTVNTSANPTRIEFNNNLIDSTLQESTGAPKNGISVRVFRETTVGKASGDDDPKAIYAAGSSIRAVDLNANTEQALYAIHELQDQEINGYEITSGTITAAGIADGAISDNHINSNAEIAVNKLQDGGPNQILHTAANGTDVEWTSNVDIPGTLDVTGNTTLDANLTVLNNLNVSGTSTINQAATFGNTVAINNQTTINAHLDVNGSASIDDIQIGSAADNLITTTSGNLELDSASGTTRVDDDLVVTGSITAPLWNGNHIDTFWLTNKQHINHIGETITLGKSSTGTGSTFQVNNAAHSFSVAKNYTFEVGRYVNEGVDLGTLSVVGYQPCFSVQHLLNETRVTKIGGSYSVTNTDESGSINLGTATASWIGTNTNLPHTNILHNYLVLSTRRGSNSGAITNPNSYCPNVVLHPTRGAMFTHPDNTAFSYSQGGSTYSALNQLAIGAYTQGTYNLGDPAGFGNNGYVDASEALALFEPAVDFQIIVGGARVKDRFEIGSSSVAGTLVLSGVDITATASELSILSGVTANSSELNKLDGFTGTTADLEEVVTGKNVVETITGSATDAQLPTAQAVNERIVELVTEVGGFIPIADEVSFPTTNPDINNGAGTIVSIGNAAGLKVADGSGSGTYAGTAGNSIGATTTAGTAVTITGIDSSLHGTTIAGKGMLVETTSTLNEYTYHRLVVDEAGVASAQAAITDFDERYYGPHSANQATRPSGANRLNGDLYFNTSDGKMKVFNGAHATGTWDDVAAPGNFFINTLSLSNGSGGGSAAFNNNATRFTLSNPPLTAQQLLVSVNGVIQKPNSGTSPSEGFAIDGADIIFASAPATNAPFFIVTIGSSVNIGTPSNDTVGAAQIIDGSIGDAEISSTAGIAKSKLAALDIVNTDVNASAAIAGSKIDPSFTANIHITNDAPKLFLTDASNNPDFSLQNANGAFVVFDDTNSAARLEINPDGKLLVGTGTTGEANADDLTIATSGHTGITLRAGTTSQSAIYMSDGTSGDDEYRGNIIYDHSDNHLRFATDALERFRIDSDGRVMIGTSTPGSGGADELTINAPSNHGGMTIRTDGSSNGNIFFADATSGQGLYAGYLQYLHSTDEMVIGVNHNERIRIDDNGNVGIGTTNPSYKLEVIGGANSLYAVGDSTTAASISFGAGSSHILRCENSELAIGLHNASPYHLYLQGRTSVHAARSISINPLGGDVAIGSIEHENIPLHVKGQSGQTTVLKLKSTEATVNQQWMQSGNANMLHQYDGLSFNTYTPSTSNTLELQHQINNNGIMLPSGKGLNFHNYGIGTDITSNKFDDYEVGEWTPVLQAYDYNNSNTYTDVTYDTALGETKGRYTKIGNIVHVWWYSSTFSLDSGYNNLSARISGFPFPKYNVAPYYGDNFNFVHTTCFKDLSGNLVHPAGGFMSPGNTWFYPILQNSTDTCRWGSEANRYIMLFGTYATSL